jgi:hypothetical protein
MRHATKTLSVMLIALLLISACSTIKLHTDAPYPISMTREISSDYNIVGHFNVEARALFTLGGLVTFRDVDFNYLVTSQIMKHGGDGAVNVRIVDQMTGMDILINAALSAAGGALGYAITGKADGAWGSLLPFILSTRTVNVKGDVIRRVRS